MPVLALCSFEGPRERSPPVSGGYGEGETPLPIPNRAVKPLSADGTWLARAWESRSPPVLTSTPFARADGVVLCAGPTPDAESGACARRAGSAPRQRFQARFQSAPSPPVTPPRA